MNNLLSVNAFFSDSGWGNVNGKHGGPHGQLQSSLAQALVLWDGGHVRFVVSSWKAGEKDLMLLEEQKAGCSISPTALTVSAILRSRHFTSRTGFPYVDVCTLLVRGSWGARGKEKWRKMECVSIQSSYLTSVSPDDPVVLKWITLSFGHHDTRWSLFEEWLFDRGRLLRELADGPQRCLEKHKAAQIVLSSIPYALLLYCHWRGWLCYSFKFLPCVRLSQWRTYCTYWDAIYAVSWCQFVLNWKAVILMSCPEFIFALLYLVRSWPD